MRNCIEATIASVIVAVVVGSVASLIIYDYRNDKKRFENRCSAISKLSNAEDYYAESFNCYIVKDNKLVKVEL